MTATSTSCSFLRCAFASALLCLVATSSSCCCTTALPNLIYSITRPHLKHKRKSSLAYDTSTAFAFQSLCQSGLPLYHPGCSLAPTLKRLGMLLDPFLVVPNRSIPTCSSYSCRRL